MALMMTMTAMMMMMVLCAMQSHTICATSHLKYSQKCRFFPLIHAVAPTFIHDNFRLIAGEKIDAAQMPPPTPSILPNMQK